MALNIYLAGGYNDIFPHLCTHTMKLRILLSYWYYKDVDLDALFAKYFSQPYPDVFADSGAFSAQTMGAKIETREYAAWLKRYQHLFDACANLDVIGDPDKTLYNQKAIEGEGVDVIPVFHVGEDFRYLENYLKDYKYIALGGMVPFAKLPKKLMPWVIKSFKIANGSAVFHGFGATSWNLIRSFPWYSVDSSSWGSGFRYGRVPLFDEHAGRFYTVGLGTGEPLQKRRLIESLGFDPMDFADRARNDRAKICAISALSYMKAEKFLRSLWGEIHIPGDSSAPAVLRAHLADANPARFGESEAGLRIHLADTGGIKENYARAEAGLKLHLADSRPHSGGDLAAAKGGLKIYLAEHSLDRGGVGDSSRAMEVLNDCSNTVRC